MMVKTERRRVPRAASKRYHVTLTPEERAELERMVSAGRAAARKLAHARVLLKADEAEGGPGWGDAQIAEALDVGRSTGARRRRTWGCRPPPACGSGSWRTGWGRRWCAGRPPGRTPGGWTGRARRG